jgi:hypothetical protein
MSLCSGDTDRRLSKHIGEGWVGSVQEEQFDDFRMIVGGGKQER